MAEVTIAELPFHLAEAFRTLEPQSHQSVNPPGGHMCLFTWTDPKKKEDYRGDGKYRWKQNGNGRFLLNGMEGKKVWFKLIIGRDKETKKYEYSTAFKKTVYFHPTENLVLTEYEGDESVAVDLPHGNATSLKKRSQGFCRTAKSVLNEILEKSGPPMDVYRQLQAEAPEDLRLHATLAPRDRKQVENKQVNERQKSRLSRCALYNLLDLAHDTKFVRKVIAHDNVAVICFDEPLVEKFAALLIRKDLPPMCWSCDTTFNLGNFYATVYTYRHTEFPEKPAVPVFYMFHETKSEEDHYFFLRFIVKTVPGLKKCRQGGRVYTVTDGEKAIVNAIKVLLPDMPLFRCENHTINDAKLKLNDLEIRKKEEQRRYKQSIRRLFSQNCEEDYNRELKVEQQSWDPRFTQYFLKCIDPDINKLGKWKCLEFLEERITTNQAESMNFVMKSLLDWKEVPIDIMCLAAFRLSQYYDREIVRGRYGFGNYRLHPHLQHLYDVDRDKPILPAVVDFRKIVDSIRTADKIAYHEEKNLKVDRDQTEASGIANVGRLATTERAMEVINKGGVELDPKKGVFYVTGTLKTQVVQLFPKTTCTCAAASSGLCYHVLACEIAINKRDDKTKKPPNSSNFRAQMKGRGPKSGRKKPNKRDLGETWQPELSEHGDPLGLLAEEQEMIRDEAGDRSSRPGNSGEAPTQDSTLTARPMEKYSDKGIEVEHPSVNSIESSRKRHNIDPVSSTKKPRVGLSAKDAMTKVYPAFESQHINRSVETENKPNASLECCVPICNSPVVKDEPNTKRIAGSNLHCTSDSNKELLVETDLTSSDKSTLQDEPVTCSTGTVLHGEQANGNDPTNGGNSTEVIIKKEPLSSDDEGKGSVESLKPRLSKNPKNFVEPLVVEIQEPGSTEANNCRGKPCPGELHGQSSEYFKKDKTSLTSHGQDGVSGQFCPKISPVKDVKHTAKPTKIGPSSSRKKQGPRSNLFPSKKDIRSITDQSWLSDVEINGALAMLRELQPNMGGLFNVQHGASADYPFAGVKWIQILHDVDHWLLAAAGFFDRDGVFLYDSLGSNTFSAHIIASCASLLRTPAKDFELHVMKCQRQTNSFDCGIFAVAFATALILGQDPSRIEFDRSVLRQHFVSCLETRQLTRFPETYCRPSFGPTSRRIVSTLKVKVFCSCRRPELFRIRKQGELKHKDEDLHSCKSCRERFHRKCESIPDRAFKTSESEWICKSCRNVL